MAELTLTDLDRIYRPPHKLVLAKSLDHVDRHGAAFIGLSPFCVISSAGPDGRQDVSPRGGEPGFVKVADPKTLVMPDRGGNNRLDNLRNLLTGGGHMGLMFMIPGFDDVYRVNGRAAVVNDEAMAADFVEFGKPPRSLVRITVEEAFLHCPKALMRARLWDPQAQQDRSALPSQTEMFCEQLGLDVPSRPESELIDSYREQL
jgi:uncharacterized protein